MGSVMMAASSLAMCAHDALERSDIVPRREDDVVEDGGRDAFRIRDLRGTLGWAELLNGMPVTVEAVGIVPPMIVAFELEELCASRVRASETQGEHGGFTAGVGETNDFG